MASDKRAYYGYITNSYITDVKRAYSSKHNPCKKDCEERKIGCTSSCEKYKNFKIKEKVFLDELLEKKRKQDIIGEYTCDKIKKKLKREFTDINYT